MKKNRSKKAFTLIELLVVISVIGIMSAFLVRVINVDVHKKEAEDTVKRATLEKLSQGIEGFLMAEGHLPSNGLADTELTDTYITESPAGYAYRELSNEHFVIWTDSSVESTETETYNIAYYSEDGKFYICLGVPPDNRAGCTLY